MSTTALAARPATSALQPLPADIEKVLVEGNLAALKPEQRVAYYNQTCQSLGLNPFTTPFDYLNLNGKLRLYAKKDATDQLRRLYDVSIRIVAREVVSDVYVVTARAVLPSGREDESTGAVTVKGKSGEDLANAWMKAETKAKRRVTLSICGLGFLDESELDGVRGARRVSASHAHSAMPITNTTGDSVDDVTGEVVNEPVRIVTVEQKKRREGGPYWRIEFSDNIVAFTDDKHLADAATEHHINRTPVEASTEKQNGGLVLIELAVAASDARVDGGEPVISEAQRKRMLAIAASGGMDHAAVKVMLAADYQIGSTRSVPVHLYDEIISKLEPSAPAAEDTEPF